MAFTPTYPYNAWRASTGVTEFQAIMADTCHNYYYGTTRPYNKMRVLAVCWEKYEISGLGTQARRVRDVFQQSYGYDVELLVIQMQDPDPDATISFNLGRLLSGLKEGDLAIFYYIGNGDQGDFQEVRAQIIDPSPADVLILLDCCVAPGIGIGHRKELIAASAFDGTTEYSPSGFTDALVQQLQHAIDNRHVLSTAQLFNHLATRHLATQFLAIQGRIPQLDAMPYFLQSSRESQAPIMLTPNVAYESWTTGAVLPIFQRPVIVVLHVHLRDAQTATLNQLGQWLLENHQHNIDKMEIKSVFPSLPKGAITIMRVTLDIWYTLRYDPAISFIGFEESDNPAIHNPPVMP
ncbi:hypothetical protein LCI18_001707 [Fusarium solani-melongenae]|uniref:Uncharacterized protein n=1 Tax=Fusarium solani subsp. cucurbitae TaxID=2747967 RepID=A0ACD3YP95_FUSSC|nr:hypothetical protein LCI18_001707 [Fusarium solani-melongenae]